MQRWLWIALLLAPLLAPLAHAQTATDPLTLQASPTSAHVAPGGAVTISVKISSHATTPLNVTLTGVGADRVIAASVSPERFTLAPASAATAVVHITVAANATPQTRALTLTASEPGGAAAKQPITIIVDPAPPPTAQPAAAAPTHSPTTSAPPATTAQRAPTVAPGVSSPAPVIPTSAAPAPLLPTGPTAAPSAASAAAPAATRGASVPPALAYAAASVGLLSLLGALAHRRWPLLLTLLYTRLRRSSLLDHPLRARLVQLVTQQPGISFGSLRAALGVGAGTLTHHARILEQAGVIFSVKKGQERCFHATGGGRVPGVDPLPERAMRFLAEHGPMAPADLARELGVSRQSLHYHLKRLSSEGRVRLAAGYVSAIL